MAIGDDRLADQDPLVRLQFNLERHGVPSLGWAGSGNGVCGEQTPSGGLRSDVWRARSGARRSKTYWNSRSTAWLACEASDRAVVDSCWRVCKANRFAPSSFESASVRLSAPVCSVLIIALVKS